MDQNDRIGALPADQYWASVEVERLPDVIRAKALEFRRRLELDARIDLWQRATRCYYGLDPEGGYKNSASITFGGPDGEQVLIRVNHFHSIAQGITTVVARQRPAFDARALSTDTEALSQAQLATSIIEAYYRDIGLETLEREAARMGWVLAEGWTALRWNPFIGRQIGVTRRPVLDDAGQPRTEMVEIDDGDGLPPRQAEQPMMEDWPEREGDVEAQTFNPQEVVRHLDAPQRDLEWVILPYRENVWDLIARYPQLRDKLIAQRMSQRWARGAMVSQTWETPRFFDDQVTVWWLYHMPTSACPQGRHAQVCGDTVIVDGPMTLREVPCYGLIPELEMTTGSGYSLAFDLLALCSAYDSIWDVVLSSHDAVGQQSIVAPKNSDVTSEMLGRGLRLLGYTPQADAPNGGAPAPLQLLAISADSFKLLEIMPHVMETLSGLNAVARGEPPPQLKSGTALALVQSLSVAFNSGFQAEVVRHHERVATGLLRLLQRHATTERMTEVTGRSKRSALKAWSAESISQVSRIAVEIAAPLMQSEAGRYQFAQDMAQNKMISTPTEFVEAFTTGNVTPLYEAREKRVVHIRTENERFLAGEPVEFGRFDDHVPHAQEHLGLLESPEARGNDALVKAVLDHIGLHISTWTTMPIAVAIATGQSVMPPPLPAMPMLAPGPLHPGPPAEHAPPPPHGAPPAPKAAPLGAPGGPHMPSMPAPPPGAPPPQS